MSYKEARYAGTECKDACQEPGSRRSCSASRPYLMLLASPRRCDQGPWQKNRGVWAGLKLQGTTSAGTVAARHEPLRVQAVIGCGKL